MCFAPFPMVIFTLTSWLFPLVTERNHMLYFFTLSDYQGFYRFEVGNNLKTEDFAFEAQKYVEYMIIVAPLLNDWGGTSAKQTIELAHYFKIIIRSIKIEYSRKVISRAGKRCL